MNDVCKKVKEMGYNFLWEPFDLDLKAQNGKIITKKVAFLKDPDGNEIELIEK